MKLLLDTSFILELRRGNSVAEDRLRELARSASDVGVSALTLYELYVGAFLHFVKRRDASELAWLESLLSWVTVYPITQSTVEVAARVKAEAAAGGLQLPDIDILIATSAGAGTYLLTFDKDHEAAKRYLSRYGVEVMYLKRG